VKTRFAPSPTGFLHLGHVVNAIYVWGLARRAGGEVLLRIEDHDRQRSRPQFEDAILDDLDWLGFEPDVYPTGAFRQGLCPGRQSDREEVYRAALAGLAARGLVYGCACTRKQLAESVYSCRCRDHRLPLTDDVGWRVHLESAGSDVLIRDRLRNWTYQWCVSVDDTVQGISHVIRGEDLRDSTERQIALARLLGRETPATFIHHSLIMKTPTQKLSKSDDDTGIRELRANGWGPGRVIAHAAGLVGLSVPGDSLAAADVRQLFEVRR
jgi:glutamyl/glutaminyl-tRNA synthetase